MILKTGANQIGESEVSEVTNTELASGQAGRDWTGRTRLVPGAGPWRTVGRVLSTSEDMEDLHWTQLNLLLLSNFYKQISAGGGETSPDQLNCGGCSRVFPVSSLAQYIQHKAGGHCSQCSPSSSVKPLGSPTITGSDQVTGRPGPGRRSYDKFCFK